MWLAKPEVLEDPSVPEGVKRYFQCFAKPIKLFGQEVLFVSQRLRWDYEDRMEYYDKQKGVGPSHSVDVAEFEKHMPKKEDKRPRVKPGTFYPVTVGEWIRQHIARGGKKFVSLHEIGERHRCDAFCD